MGKRFKYQHTEEEIALFITSEITNNIDNGYGFEISRKAYNLLSKHYPLFLGNLPRNKKIIINSDEEKYTTELILVDNEKNYGSSNDLLTLGEYINQGIYQAINNSLNFKPINFTSALHVDEDALKQLLTGGKTMEINIKGLTQEQLNSIKKQIEEFEKENEKPKDVIDYMNGWVITVDGVSKTNVLTNSLINNRYELGLYRDTKEECEKLIKKMKIEHRLRQWAKMCKDKIDWLNDEQNKYTISLIDGKLKIDYRCLTRGNDVYFTDKSILEKAIADIGEQKLIDEYFVEV